MILGRVLWCSKCGLVQDLDSAARNGEGWFCPRCWMDESGQEVVDLVRSSVDRDDSMRYDDRMIESSTKRPAGGITARDRVTIRRELMTDPDIDERAEEIAEQIRALLHGEDEELMCFIEDRACEHFAHLLDPAETIPENEEDAIHLQAVAMVTEVLQLKTRRLIARILSTGDWR